MKRVLACVLIAACGGSPKPAPAPAPEAPAPAPAPAPGPTLAHQPPAAELRAPPPAAGPDVKAYCDAELAAAKASRDQVYAAAAPRTIDNTLVPYNELQRHAANAAIRANLLQNVSPDAAARDASRACGQAAQQLASEVALDKKLYDALKAVDVSKADPDTKRMVFLSLRDAKVAGVELDDAKRKRAQEIDDALTKVGQDFEKNIAEDTRSIDVTTDRLKGMPADWIAAHPVHDGKITITTDYPDYIPVQTFADDDDLRKQLYILFLSRGDKGNDAVLKQMLALRAERAKDLGYPSWADSVSADKMLAGGKAEADFLTRVTKLAKARGQRDYNELLAQLKKTDPKAKTVTSWQKAKAEQEVKRDKYAVDAAEVRTYFSYDATLKGLLDITSRIYDIQYKPVAHDPLVWHPDVQVFDVMRNTQTLGRIYLDMHPRADKYKHAAEFGILDGNEGTQSPSGALVCNLPDPKTANGPALMDHGDVVTMFHEFGHLMHHILGGHHRWERLAGTSVEQDFVEAPSQMFEEWAWSYDTLKLFAKNGKGETIPEDLVKRMRKARDFGQGTQTLQQMLYASLSLELHRANPKTVDPLALTKKLQAQITPFAYVEGTHFYDSFGHLSGYSSMYYTYMWSLVIAKDLLTPFEKTGLMDTAITQKYRDTILAQGAAKPAADLVKDFLGRPYNFTAFEKFLSQ
ncbi:MAG: M3 family metallopeptidase [Kofleriaceae bacterium]